MALNLEVNILGDYKKLTKATKGAEKRLDHFGKTGKKMSKSLGRAFGALGVSFGAAALARGFMDSAKAASEDMRSQKLLAMTLERNGKAKASDVKATEAMISRMELATGVADDELRPAMGKLTAATGDVNKAQGLLKVALGVSAKYGKPLDTVTQALSKAFNGNTTSLTRMIPQLKTSKDVMGDLRRDVKGFAKENADPFERLNRGIDQFKEMVGADLAKSFGDLMDKIATPGSPEAKAVDELGGAVKDMATSFNTFFKEFDPDKQSGFVGFMTSLKTSALTTSAFLELPSAIGKTIRKEKLDPKQYPGLYAATEYQRQQKKTETANAVADKIWRQQQFFSRGNGLAQYGSLQNFQVTINTTKTMTPDETVKMIRAWEKKHGVKYNGPIR